MAFASGSKQITDFTIAQYTCMHACIHLWSSPFSQMMSIQVNGREDLIDCNIVYKIVINVIYTYNKYNTRD